ncbi:hypothetical protein LZD49_27135 [Dyadobacter sp. CY261]|uniref:hypothetical protein n=1 Tax=Dyadobacter sp. CY261 TaxID=2907203 RepID=UPI001F465A7E|nr:hypothetical protein [Dyadobacter sp. CY261]MCF0074188.1 hypothetical protein [Dyadobacter sp. CY261]
MKTGRFVRLTAGVLVSFGIRAFGQVEIVEHLPEDTYVANWQPVFFEKIVSYVQLPGDPSEYKKIKTYVMYRAKQNIEKVEELLKFEDLTRQRYLGAFLVRTGRTFTTLLDNSVLGVENTNLTTQDQLINNETISVRQDIKH